MRFERLVGDEGMAALLVEKEPSVENGDNLTYREGTGRNHFNYKDNK